MLRVAHNAQQYAPSPLPFELYHTLPSYLLSPNTGPLSGGTRINITADTSLDPPPRDDSCSYYADDGACDEPWICAAGTDCTDCAFHSGTQCGFRPGTDRRCRFEPVVDEQMAGDQGMEASALTLNRQLGQLSTPQHMRRRMQLGRQR